MTEYKLVPAILSSDVQTYIDKILFYADIFDTVHIDITEKIYTNHINTPTVHELIEKTTDIKIYKNFHLMLHNPLDYLDYLYHDSNVIFIYVRSKYVTTEILEKYKEKLVLTYYLEDTNLNENKLKIARHIQLMSVKIGSQGQSFNDFVLNKTNNMKNIPEINKKTIHFDGGLNPQSIKKISKQITVKPYYFIFNIGSFFANSKDKKTLQTKTKLINETLKNNHFIPLSDQKYKNKYF